MTYQEVVEKVRTLFGSADVSNIREHLAYQFNITGDAAGIFYVEVKDGQLVTSGGRVLMVIGSGDTLLQAHDKALEAVGKIKCDNLFYRRDIGWRVL